MGQFSKVTLDLFRLPHSFSCHIETPVHDGSFFGRFAMVQYRGQREDDRERQSCSPFPFQLLFFLCVGGGGGGFVFQIIRRALHCPSRWLSH